MTHATAAIARACKRSRAMAAAMRAIRTNPARNCARKRSIRPPQLPDSNAAPPWLISTARSRHERAPLCLAARNRGGDGAAGGGSYRHNLLCKPPGHERGRRARSHPRQHRLRRFLRPRARRAWPARGRRGGAAVIGRELKHRRSALWLAAILHRISGLALAIFLPFHFLALGLAINGEARLENFLRWTDQPL